MRLRNLSRLRVPVVLLALLPYVAELFTEAVVAVGVLPASSGITSGTPSLVVLLAASVWAPLSPSIVIPNALTFADAGLEQASGFVLTAAPLEIGTAILTFSSLESTLEGAGSPGWLPVSLLGSLAFGFAWALVYQGYKRFRLHPTVVAVVQAPEPMEAFIVWILCYLLSYELPGDTGGYVPKLVGFLSALAMALGTQFQLPGEAETLAATLKPVWAFAECFLFVLTGVVVRGAIDGDTAALSPAFAFVLLCGTVARLVADVAAGAAWGVVCLPPPGVGFTLARARRLKLRDVVERTLLVWAMTMPKATLQASLGPRPAAEAAKLGIPQATGDFISQSCAISILYMATLGSLLTFSLGQRIAVKLEADAAEVEAGEKGDAEFALLEEAPATEQSVERPPLIKP